MAVLAGKPVRLNYKATSKDPFVTASTASLEGLASGANGSTQSAWVDS